MAINTNTKIMVTIVISIFLLTIPKLSEVLDSRIDVMLWTSCIKIFALFLIFSLRERILIFSLPTTADNIPTFLYTMINITMIERYIIRTIDAIINVMFESSLYHIDNSFKTTMRIFWKSCWRFYKKLIHQHKRTDKCPNIRWNGSADIGKSVTFGGS